MRRVRRGLLEVIVFFVLVIIVGVAAKSACFKSNVKVEALIKEMVATRESQTQIQYLSKSFGPVLPVYGNQCARTKLARLARLDCPVCPHQFLWRTYNRTTTQELNSV